MTSENITLLRIGELHRVSQVPIKTIRYYEALGLIQADQRTEGGFRLFYPEVADRLAFIKRTQSLGFSLEEIGHILNIHDQGELPCAEVRQQLQIKITEIDQRIAQLQTLRTELISLTSESPSLEEISDDVICPILQSPG
ncbi:Mercuric resistance operon regulatory protein [Acaryochloris thomasi RCC1774]|uniref:Mercuric resistance operon regulatory protein n=1 Tax=Acaryochloris thomasi RCC1774 TaxID=1764569 RepID=A0A2W1JZT2_9CYAN|nr:heavy metal-responsive transcriptional regulator [Acaryochloris thomasi]PZD75412.1 Mercuric resistance operon regulatory protein [Acaryochloris thomasi RCC1774]